MDYNRLELSEANVNKHKGSNTPIILDTQGQLYRLREHRGIDENGNTTVAASSFDEELGEVVGSTKYITIKPGEIAEILVAQPA